MKLELQIWDESGRFGVSQVDKEGKGIIVCSGHFEGGTTLPERYRRVKVLEEMIGLWNEYEGA